MPRLTLLLLGCASAASMWCAALTPAAAVAARPSPPVPLAGAARAGRATVKVARGRALAERVLVRHRGTARLIEVAVSGRLGGPLVVGVYGDRHGRPGQLLSSGTGARSATGWARLTIRPTSVQSGRAYWIVVASRARLEVRTHPGSACRSVGMGAGGSLPRRWPGTRARSCPVSLMLLTGPRPGSTDGTIASAHPRPGGTGAPAGGGTSTPAGPAGPAAVTGAPASSPSSLPTALPPYDVARPLVIGEPEQGQTLVISPGAWAGSPSYVFQWQRCASVTSCSDIPGATDSTYVVRSADVGDTLQVVVTATNSGGSASDTSPATKQVLAAGAIPGQLSGISVTGNHLVNGSGQTVVLHGVDRSGTEYMCSEGYGITDGPASTDTSPTEFGPMKTWGLNSVFIGLNEDCWLGINGVSPAFSQQNYIDEIKAEVAQAESDGLYPVIGFFWGDPGSLVPGPNDPNGGGQEPMPDNDHAPLFWQQVADTFKSDPNVIFRLQEEPHPGNNGDSLSIWQCWSKGDVQYATTSDNAFATAPSPVSAASHCSEHATDGSTSYSAVGMQSLVNIIRGTGATNVIQVPGIEYANAMDCPGTSPVTCGFLDSTDGVRVSDPLSAPQLMADADVYPDGAPCGSVSCYAQSYAPVIAQMPFEAGETGPSGGSNPDLGPVNQFLDWMDSEHAGYYAWAWDTWSNLIANYSGDPQTPWGVAFRDRLVPPPPPAQPSGGITFRQVAQAPCVASSGTSGTVTLSSAVSPGDDLYLVVGGQGYAGAASTVTSVSDNVNGAWTQLANSGSQSASYSEYVSYAVYELRNSAAAPSGLRITVNGVSGQSGMSAMAADVGGVASDTLRTFDSAVQPQPSGNPAAFVSPALNGLSAGDVVLGLYGSYTHPNQTYTAPSGWNMSDTYWTNNQYCGSAAIDWKQVTAAGSVSATIDSTQENHFSGAIDLKP